MYCSVARRVSCTPSSFHLPSHDDAIIEDSPKSGYKSCLKYNEGYKNNSNDMVRQAVIIFTILLFYVITFG